MVRITLLSVMSLPVAMVTCAGQAPSEWEQGKGSIALVADGRATAMIVVAANPARYAQIAALELQTYVQKITGTKLDITTDELPHAGKGYRVLVGESRLTREMGYRSDDFARDEFVVDLRGPRLVLMGRDAPEYGWVTHDENGHWPGFWPDSADHSRRAIRKDHGSLLAVYEFLEEFCGVRWYMVTEIGEVVPTRKALNFANLFVRRKPWCATRVFNIEMPAPWHFAERWGAKGSPLGERSIHTLGPGHQGWRRLFMWLERVRFGGTPYSCNHSLYSTFERFGQDHPDWFANGKPAFGGQMCYSNVELVKQVAQDVCDYFDGKYSDGRYPVSRAYWITAAGDFHAVMPMDNRDYCTCADCRPKWQEGQEWMFFGGRASDYVWAFVNNVAREVGREHPDRFVTCCAYCQYTVPPSFPLEPNVAVMYCKSTSQYGDPRRKAFDRKWLPEWRKRAKHLSTWEYYNFPRGAVFPGVAPRRIAEDMAFLRGLPIDGQFIELDSVNPALEHLNLYCAMKLLDDPTTDIDALLDGYYKLFYGPAEQPMRQFFEKIESIATSEENWKSVLSQGGEHLDRATSWEVMCPPDTLADFGELIQQALAAVKEEQPYLDRVRLMELAIYGHMVRSSEDYWDQRRREAPKLVLPEVAEPPVIDGKLDDRCWAQAAATGELKTIDGKKPKVKTSARLACDYGFLYVAVECTEPEPDKIVAAQRDRDSNVFTEDCIEIFLDPDRADRKYFQIAFNTLGALNDAAVEKGGGRDQAWDPDIRVAIAKGEDRWTAEIAIPLAGLGFERVPRGAEWGANVCRDRVAGGKAELSAWSPTFESWHQLRDFGVIVFPQTGK